MGQELVSKYLNSLLSDGSISFLLLIQEENCPLLIPARSSPQASEPQRNSGIKLIAPTLRKTLFIPLLLCLGRFATDEVP